MARAHVTKENSYLVTWTVEPGEVGRRLDHFLKEKYRRLSREYLQKYIRDGMVTINQQPTKPSRILRAGDKVYVLSIKGDEPEVDFDFKVLYEDDDILVVDKPGNLPVHPTGRFFFNTLLTQLRVVNQNEVDQARDFFVVHRVDRETSGVLVLGKTSAAAANMVEQFTGRRTDKEYLAVVRGVVEKDSFVVDAPLAKCPHSEIRLKMAVVEMDAKGKPLYLPESEVLPSVTSFEVIERLRGYTILRCKPLSGRQHQIRVHLFHVGHPIVGDKLYGTSADFFLETIKAKKTLMEVEQGVHLSRHALHAHKLKLRHPRTGEWMEFVSEWPAELGEFLDRVREQESVRAPSFERASVRFSDAISP